MTKERKLAIEMWQNIRDMLSASNGRSPECIPRYKRMFCIDHDLKWAYSCWFCQYMQDCTRCPLGNCGHNSNYEHVVTHYRLLDKDTRIEACNNIIKALGGSV